MKTALQALNSIKKAGVIDDYAIGGAIAASFYIEATNTEDVDVFLFMSASENSVLLSLSPIYDALKQLGGRIEKEYIVFGDWPVQILPAYNALVEEAVKQAVTVQYGDIETKIFTAEYLCAIALDTGRIKDFYRVASFIEQQKVDRAVLNQLVSRFKLEGKTKNVLNWNDDESK
ncbi:MAG: hypothetical protein PHQ60_15285 [Sideroxydans sp.]|nr:hypothetical protein [Sideroxydans sp.]